MTRRQRTWFWLLIAFGAALLFALMAGLILFREPVSFRLRSAWSRIYQQFNPPEEVVFLPSTATPGAPPNPTASPSPTPSETPRQTETPAPTFTASPSPTPLPPSIDLNGVKHEYQGWNNCGPANLSMALSFWGWDGDQWDTGDWLKPHRRDKNVSPEEIVAYVETQTSARALWRVGGDLDTLRRLLAAGYPVLIERGMIWQDEGWLGHYQLLTGYDDNRQRFIAQDSLIMADFPVPYDELALDWRSFNYVFIVVYAQEYEGDLMYTLGELADPAAAVQHALDIANQEVFTQTGREAYFAWYNLGSALAMQEKYPEAAAAFDQAFLVYAGLDPDIRPWRLTWYMHGVFPAYFYSGRYDDVIDLATKAINTTSEPGLEESWTWRGRARAALGQTDAAIEDFRKALEWHAGYAPALEELAKLEVTP
ncbi:MAG: hypothetical protein HPY76_07800 [Anaerolineae bacterium]|nr:hypothetical protein [Anaerolineae bacterium]